MDIINVATSSISAPKLPAPCQHMEIIYIRQQNGVKVSTKSILPCLDHSKRIESLDLVV